MVYPMPVHDLMRCDPYRSRSFPRALGLICLLAVPASMPMLARAALSSNQPVRIVLVGDSTVADSSGWGLGFKCFVNDRAQGINLATGGRSSMSYMRERRWENAKELKADYYLIQFGHNDQPGKPGVSTEPEKGYREYMTRYVVEAKAIGAQPVLITPLTRREFGKDGKIHSSLAPYASVVRDIAAQQKVPLVDLQASSIALCDELGRERVCEMSVIPTLTSPSFSTRTQIWNSAS